MCIRDSLYRSIENRNRDCPRTEHVGTRGRIKATDIFWVHAHQWCISRKVRLLRRATCSRSCHEAYGTVEQCFRANSYSFELRVFLQRIEFSTSTEACFFVWPFETCNRTVSYTHLTLPTIYSV